MSGIEREIMIDNLSESAKQTFRDIQSTEKYIYKEKSMFNKRRNLDQSEYDGEEDDDEDEDEDDEDEQNEDLPTKTVNVKKNAS